MAINILDDNLAEVVERFCAEIVSITSDLDVTRGSNSTASIDIEDNDAIEINFDPVVYNVQEGSDAVLVAVATKPASFNYTITVQTEDGSATSKLIDTNVHELGKSFISCLMQVLKTMLETPTR